LAREKCEVTVALEGVRESQDQGQGLGQGQDQGRLRDRVRVRNRVRARVRGQGQGQGLGLGQDQGIPMCKKGIDKMHRGYLESVDLGNSLEGGREKVGGGRGAGGR
jgi:hypothetical protein